MNLLDVVVGGVPPRLVLIRVAVLYLLGPLLVRHSLFGKSPKSSLWRKQSMLTTYYFLRRKEGVPPSTASALR